MHSIEEFFDGEIRVVVRDVDEWRRLMTAAQNNAVWLDGSDPLSFMPPPLLRGDYSPHPKPVVMLCDKCILTYSSIVTGIAEVTLDEITFETHHANEMKDGIPLDSLMSILDITR